LPDRTSWVPFSLAQRRISLAPGNRTTVNVEPWFIYNICIGLGDPVIKRGGLESH